ncbi:hypothetical protein ACLMJK_002364 [Lecanora helva]
MSNKPIFVATHPRACSTAFERVFMTRRDAMKCIHEPFGDAFYYGPERLSARFEHDEDGRIQSGFLDSTFKTVVDRLEAEGAEGKRLLIKDMIYYLMPPNGGTPSIAPSLARKERGVGTAKSKNDSNKNNTNHRPYAPATKEEHRNPTVMPNEILGRYHFVFLIRHPRYSVPSWYRCTVPPMDRVTDFYDFMPSEAGYQELRRIFDYLRSTGQIGPGIANKKSAVKETNGHVMTNGILDSAKEVEVCVVDADDLLDNPEGIVKAFCESVRIDFCKDMLNWPSDEDYQQAVKAFEKWPGFHDDAIESRGLKPRQHKKQPKTEEVEDSEWREKYGDEGAKIIRTTVDANIKDYEYLKQFALRVEE